MNSFYVINKENKYLQTRAIVFHHKILDIADNIEKQLTRDGRENYKKFKEIILSDPFAVISQPKTEKQSIIEIPYEFVVNKSSLNINKNCSSEELSEWGGRWVGKRKNVCKILT